MKVPEEIIFQASEAQFQREGKELRTVSADSYYHDIARLPGPEQNGELQTFQDYFKADITQYPPLSYNEAKVKTVKYRPGSTEQLVAKITYAYVHKDSGELMIAAPSPTLELPENEMHHSSIPLTWFEDAEWYGAQRREELLAELRKSPGFDYSKSFVRAFVLQTQDGKVVLAIDPAREGEIPEDYKKKWEAEYGVHYDSEVNFEGLIGSTQVSEQIKHDADILKAAGVPDTEIKFYTYWATRFWVVNDHRPELLDGKLAEKWQKIEEIRMLQTRLMNQEKRKREREGDSTARES